MAWRPKPKHARVDPSSPCGWATDQKSGFITNLERMEYQLEWRGLGLASTGVLSFGRYLDVPQRQLGTVILPPDPPGLLNARPEAYPSDEYWSRLLQNGAPRYLQTAAGTKRAQPRTLQYSKYFT